MKKFLIFLLAFVPMLTLAQSSYPRDISHCWTLPSLNTDGSSIQDGDLSHVRIVTVRNSGETVLDTNIPIGDLLPGDRQCFNSVGAIPGPGQYASVAYAVTVDDISSDASNEAYKRYTGKPQPPNPLDHL
jgi:hypothetical protein